MLWPCVAKCYNAGMANGIPVRLSVDLAQRARTAAETADRSVTEQVEHWARLGQAVEDVVLAKTVERLKARSHDADLTARIAMADTSEGRAKALALINARNPVRHGTDARGELRVVRGGKSASSSPSAISSSARSKAMSTSSSPSASRSPSAESPSASSKTMASIKSSTSSKAMSSGKTSATSSARSTTSAKKRAR